MKEIQHAKSVMAILTVVLSAILLIRFTPASAARLASMTEPDAMFAPLSTDVGGTIMTDTTWTEAGSPYVVTANVIVDEGFVLTIEPGVEVRFAAGTLLDVKGGLFAQGTMTKTIRFTSNESNPAAGDWGYILFHDSSLDANYDAQDNYVNGSILEYVTVEYAGSDSSTQGAVRLDAAAPFIHHSTIQHNANGGIYSFNGGDTRISGSLITDNSTSQERGGGIYVDGPATIDGNRVTNNSVNRSSCCNNGYGGGVYAINGAQVTNNTVTDNTVTAYYYAHGGGIYASNSTVTDNHVTANMLTANNNHTYGGGVYATNSTVTDNVLSGNTSTARSSVYGGGLYANGSTISDNTVADNVSTANSSHIYGGGIYATSSSHLSGNIVSGNTSTADDYVYGGGVRQSGGNFTGNTVVNNSSIATKNEVQGGGVYFDSGGNFTDNIIADNVAQTNATNQAIYGVGVYLINGSGSFKGNALLRNEANSNGGFVYGAGAYLSTSGQVQNNTVVGNIAPDTDDAGGLYLAAQTTVNNNNIYANGERTRLGPDLYNGNEQGSTNLDATSNYWGTIEPKVIQDQIYDWFDDLGKGFVDYLPYLSTHHLDAPLSPPNGVQLEVLSESSLRVSWDANLEADVIGYRLFYSTTNPLSFNLAEGETAPTYLSSEHTTHFPYKERGALANSSPIDVGNSTVYTLTGLTTGSFYFVTVQAIDHSGNQSWYAAEVGTQVDGAAGTSPATPTHVSPADGATDVSVTPALSSSAFFDSDGDGHLRSQWQITTMPNGFGSLVYDSGEVTALTTFGVPAGVLQNEVTYYWRVRHQDIRHVWSAWSTPTAFTVVSGSELKGRVCANTTWTAAASPYFVTNNVLVCENIILTIEPGVEVQFAANKAMQVDGGLVAQGTEMAPITFTSDEFNPDAGDWGYILFTDSSLDANYNGLGDYLNGSILEYVTVEYAGSDSSIQGALRLDAAAPFIHHSTIQHNANGGIYSFNGGDTRISGSLITDNRTSQERGGGIYVDGPATIDGNRVTNNSVNRTSCCNNGYGGGVYATNGAQVTNNTVRDNTVTAYSYAYGGGLYASNSTVRDNHVTANTLTANNYEAYGGGVHATNSTVTDNVVSGNTSTAGRYVYGGGLYANSSTVSNNTVADNVSTANSSNIYGGGIYATSSSHLSGNIVSGNTSTADDYVYGGGVNQSGGNFTDNTVVNNSSIATKNEVQGGGVYFNSGGNFTDNTIADNVAQTNATNQAIYGVGVYLINGSASFKGNALVRNEANSNGGFVYGAGAYLSTSGQVQNNTVVGNIAPDTDDAGGLYLAAQTTVNHNNIYANGERTRLGPDLYNGNEQGSANLDATSNYWGTIEPQVIPDQIYDWFDDLGKGFVDDVPYLSTHHLDAPLSPPNGMRLEVLSESSLRVSWDANLEADVIGYRLSYTTTNTLPFDLAEGETAPTYLSSEHTTHFPYKERGVLANFTPIDVGNSTVYTLTRLTTGTFYFVTVQAIDHSGNQSWYAAEVGAQVNGGAGTSPATPTNVSPADRESEVSVTPALRSSAFSDSDGDGHLRSQWQITTISNGFGSPVYDSGETTALTTFGVPAGILQNEVTYYWRVRHQDIRHAWSAWSTPTAFTVESGSQLKGRVCANTTWTAAASPYFVTNNVLVCENVILTIEPGVEVQFAANKAMQVDGGLVAQGTEMAPITFTSDEFNPDPGDWGYILFTDSSLDANYNGLGDYVNGTILEYVTVKYAGSASSIQGAVRLDAAAPFIHNSTIQHNANGGIYSFNGGDTRISGNLITDNSTSQERGGGIYVDGAATIDGNRVTNNSVNRSSNNGYGGGVYASNGAQVTNNTVRDNTVTAYSNAYGGGLYASNSTVTDNHVTVNMLTANYDNSYGGGVYATNSTVTDNVVSGNTSTARDSVQGGGLYVNSSTVSGNTVADNVNTANYERVYGGGIYATSSSDLSGNMVSGNTVTADDYVYGGGVHQSGGNFTGNTVLNNTSIATNYDIQGGGVYFNSSGGNFTGNIIAYNVARTNSSNRTISGAGVYLINGNGLFKENAIVHNEADTHGGFVYGAGAYLNSTAETSCNTVINNILENSDHAGGIYVYNSSMKFNDSNLFDNDGYDLYNRTGSLDAKNNYWSTTDDSTIQAMINGTVDYSGYLSDLSSCAPVAPTPEIEVTPSGLEVTLEALQSATKTFTLQNNGTAALNFTLTDTLDGLPNDWLSQAPTTGSVAPAASQDVVVYFDASHLEVGVYTATIMIDNNDLDENMTAFPVTFTVTAPPVISEVHRTNVRDAAFTVSWLTQVAANGSVRYGTSPDDLSQIAYDKRGTNIFDDIHYVILQDLTPNTTYYFDIVSGFTVDNNGGSHYTVTTGAALGVANSDAIYGQIFNQDGMTLTTGAIVYITLYDANGSGSLGEAAPLSALVDHTGYWHINLGNARTTNLNHYFVYSASGDQIEVEAQGASDGRGCNQMVDTANDTPSPNITLNVSPCPTLWSLNIPLSFKYISLPLNPLTPYQAEGICSDIRSQGGDIGEINRWYAAGWDGHICTLPFNNFSLTPGSGYFLRGDAASTWSIEGFSVTTPVTLPLQIGWNSIGIPHTNGYTADSLCNEIINQGVTAVEIDRWYAAGWDSHICGLPFNNFSIEIGEGYFVKANSAGDVAPPRLPSRSPIKSAPVSPPKTLPQRSVAIKELKISNLRDSAVTISWLTAEPTTGYVVFGEKDKRSKLDQKVYDVRQPNYVGYTHYVVLTDLAPERTYFFDIVSGAGIDDNGGKHYSVTTLSQIESVPPSDTIYGQLFQSDGITPAAGTIVYLTLMDMDNDARNHLAQAMLASALVDANGYWHTNLGNIRLSDGSGAFVDSTDKDAILHIQAGVDNIITQTVDTNDLRTAPTWLLTPQNTR